MPIHVTDLPPKYQAQVVQKYMAQQRWGPIPSAAAVQGEAKGRKYHNTHTERVTADGTVIRFDSQKEARRYDDLVLRLKAGVIRDLRLQVDFTLQEAYTDPAGHRIRAIRYRADFTYANQDDHLVVEDVKSSATRTREYLLKRKLMKEKFGVDIQEV